MQCSKPLYLDKAGIRVPCGRCRACRIRRGHEWSMRMAHEQAASNYSGMFITLTYDDEHLPHRGSLQKKDLQNFFKRVRKEISNWSKFDRVKIKYYASGEYGEETARPHYHGIIFGLSAGNNMHRNVIYDSWDKCIWNWRRKQKSIGSVEKDSILYCTKYIQKKFYNSDDLKHWLHYGYREPEFQIQSQGIGKTWCDNNKNEIEATGKVTYRGKKVNPPRYYTGRCEIPISIKVDNKNEVLEKERKKHGIKVWDFYDKGVGVRFTTEEQDANYLQLDKNLKARENLTKSRRDYII